MNQNKFRLIKLKKNIVWGLIVAMLGMGCSLWLLIDLEKLSGAEFVTLSLGFAVIGLIIAFAAEVQEFSIAGNGVKLKELRTEAEKTIEELKQARTELFRILIQKSIEFSGGFGGGSKVDERLNTFFQLFKQIEKFNCIRELKHDIENALNILMVSQFNNLEIIHESSKTVGDNFDEKDKPDFLYIKFKDEMVHKILGFYGGNKPSFEYIQNDILKGVEAYAKLYAIKIQLDKL